MKILIKGANVLRPDYSTDIADIAVENDKIAAVGNIIADQRYIDKTTGAFDMTKAKLIAYSHGKYYKLGDEIGRFGWSVKKK